jgi:hypothetical protein
MNTYEAGGIAPPFLTSAIYGGERPVSHLGRFALRERAPVPFVKEAAWGSEQIRLKVNAKR